MRRPTKTNDRSALLLLLYSEEPIDDELELVYDPQRDINMLGGASPAVAVESLGPIPTQTGTRASNDPTDQD